MTRDVLITIVSTQIEEDQKLTTELITSGKLKKTAKGFEIAYAESETTGFAGSNTILSVEGENLVTMNRTGACSSQLIIEKGNKHRCHYGTPYGEFIVGIATRYIKSDLSENGGTLEFSYTLDINSSYIADFELSLKIEEEKGK